MITYTNSRLLTNVKICRTEKHEKSDIANVSIVVSYVNKWTTVLFFSCIAAQQFLYVSKKSIKCIIIVIIYNLLLHSLESIP